MNWGYFCYSLIYIILVASVSTAVGLGTNKCIPYVMGHPNPDQLSFSAIRDTILNKNDNNIIWRLTVCGQDWG